MDGTDNDEPAPGRHTVDVVTLKTGKEIRVFKYRDSDTFIPASEAELFPKQCPKCGQNSLIRAGGCGEGCCDDYKCTACGYAFRVEFPD